MAFSLILLGWSSLVAFTFEYGVSGYMDLVLLGTDNDNELV